MATEPPPNWLDWIEPLNAAAGVTLVGQAHGSAYHAAFLARTGAEPIDCRVTAFTIGKTVNRRLRSAESSCRQ